MPLPVCEIPGHVCEGHRCDRCIYCEQGVCCGEAVVEIDLPAQGSWPLPTFAPIGKMLADEDGRLICHICGEAHIGLYKHIAKHGVNADQYRATFGLRVSQSLMSPVNSDLRAERTGEQMRQMDEALRAKQIERLEQYRQSFTPEQRSTWAYAREHRLQSQTPGSFHDPVANAARSASFHAQRRADPAKDRAWRGKLIVAKRRRVDPGRECIVCGAVFCTVNARGIRQVSPRLTCGDPACKSEVRRRAQAKATEARKRNASASIDVLKVLATTTVRPAKKTAPAKAAPKSSSKSTAKEAAATPPPSRATKSSGRAAANKSPAGKAVRKKP